MNISQPKLRNEKVDYDDDDDDDDDNNNNNRITLGLKTLCKHKWELYLAYINNNNNNNNLDLKRQYQLHCKFFLT